MALADDIRKLGADARADLAAVLDYHYQSIAAWDELSRDVRAGRVFSVQNVVTATSADQAQIIARVPGYIERYLTPATFQQLITTFEAFFFDLLALWLRDHPGILLRKQVELETVLAAADTATVLQGVIDRELNEVKYRKVAEWFEYLRKLVGVPGPSADQVAGLAEAKASRDILVHGKGIVNPVYLAKAGAKARHAVGDVLELPDPYVRTTFGLVETVVGDVAATVASKA